MHDAVLELNLSMVFPHPSTFGLGYDATDNEYLKCMQESAEQYIDSLKSIVDVEEVSIENETLFDKRLWKATFIIPYQEERFDREWTINVYLSYGITCDKHNGIIKTYENSPKEIFENINGYIFCNFGFENDQDGYKLKMVIPNF